MSTETLLWVVGSGIVAVTVLAKCATEIARAAGECVVLFQRLKDLARKEGAPPRAPAAEHDDYNEAERTEPSP